jgi:hypothetical protein
VALAETPRPETPPGLPGERWPGRRLLVRFVSAEWLLYFVAIFAVLRDVGSRPAFEQETVVAAIAA